jgi:type IX secretion system PorP/SprF family membrane protein
MIFGQQLPLFSQYLYNKYLINPAVAGSDGYTSFSLTGREQWVGYSGGPRTFSFSAQTRMLKKKAALKQGFFKGLGNRPKADGKVGLGGYIFNDVNGLVKRSGFQISYAYHMWLKQNTQLSMGLAFTGYNYRINEKEINFADPNEPLLNSDLRQGIFVPDMAFGVYLLNTKYCLGFSVDQLFQAYAKIGSYAYKNFKMDRQYYLFGSYDFYSGGNNVLQPSFLFKVSEQLRPQTDLGVTYIYNHDFWIGLAYRTSGALIANVGLRYQNIYVGYAYDFTMQEFQRVTYGTHEITLVLKLGDKARKYRWLDRY